MSDKSLTTVVYSLFMLREITRIRLCRLAFVALCILPTCAVLAWSGAIRSSSYRQAHERALGVALGCDARLARVSLPRPNTTLYERIELADPETRQLLADLPFVEIHDAGNSTTVAFPFPTTINGTRLDALWRPDVLRPRDAQSSSQIHFECQNLTLKLPDRSLTLTALAGDIEDNGDRAQLTLSFRQAQADGRDPGPCQVSISRHRRPSQATVIEMTTGERPLPCSLAMPFWSGSAGMGKSSTFRGRLRATVTSAGWEAALVGELADIDMDQLFRDRFPHHLAGTARLQLDEAILRDGRILSATGRLSAGPGQASTSLVRMAQTHLGFQVPSAAVAGETLPFEQLGMSFSIDADGLVVRGACAKVNGAILADAQGRALMLEGSTSPQPPLNLVRTLVPDSRLHVPATVESDWLTHHLPIPQIEPTREGQRTARAKTLKVTPKSSD